MEQTIRVETFGILFVGVIYASIQYGINTVHICSYFALRKRDPMRYKTYAATLWLLDTIHTNLIGHAVLTYLVMEPLAMDSKMLHSLSQKLIFPIAQGLVLWILWYSLRGRFVPIILIALVVINLGAGLRLGGQIFTLPQILQLREAAFNRLVFLSLSATAALDNTIMVIRLYSSSRAGGAKLSLAERLKPLLSRRVFFSILIGYMATVTTFNTTFTFLAIEVALTKLYIYDAIELLNTRRRRTAKTAGTTLVLMGDSLYYQAERTTNITQIHLSPELAVEFQKVIIDTGGEIASQGSGESLPLNSLDKSTSV